MKKYISLLLSAVIAAGTVLPAVFCSSDSGSSAKAYSGYSDAELIDVVVRLNGDAVLAAPEAQGQGSGYIDSESAQLAESAILDMQSQVERNFRRLYPDFQIKRRFTLTLNAFSCELPEAVISELQSDPLIRSVTKVSYDTSVKPDLSSAKEACGVTDFCNNTGCTGEGEVIAVIDTEFDITHDMFAPMSGVEVRLSKEDIAGISSSDGFSSKLSADEVYISNKIPFAYDYSDDTPYTLSSSANYHGTHVAGIAAGGRFINSEGREISGIAPDAQVLMMKVFGNKNGNEDGVYEVSDEAIAAALEDAVKLRADVINMSFGRTYEHYEERIYAEAIASAANAGITLCASAGNKANDGIGSGNMITVNNVDTGNINEPAMFPQVLAVAAADNTITDGTDSENMSMDISVSLSSSYGVGTSLELKPEIMGIGGNIESAAYGNTTERLSGTSMASPYIAGCAALYDQYMKKQKSELSGEERSQIIKNILMSSAMPCSEDDMFISPRRQGAGLVSLDRAINDKVIMTGASGKADIELFDGIGARFSFELNITNISNEDVTFPYSDVRLTSDGYKYDERSGKTYISGQTSISSENDLGSNITVPAGSSKSVTVTVTADAEQTAELGRIFKNGFFIEGFVSLYGADNCCDISVPLIGFCGDWCAVPTIDTERYPIISRVSIGEKELRTDISFARAAAMLRDIVYGDISYDPDKSDNYPMKAEFTDEQKKQFDSLSNGITYFSPDYDGFGDFLGCYYVPSREASFTEIDLYDEQDKLLYSTRSASHNSFRTQLALLPGEAYSLPDAAYRGRINSHIEYRDAAENEQSYPFDIVIDTAAPEVTYETVCENGRKLLKLTASDAALDGIYIMGMKSGDNDTDSRACFNALALAMRTLSYDSLPENNKRIMYNYIVHSQEAELTSFRNILTGKVKPQSYYNFCDIITAEPDENGTFSIVYDITDLIEYTVSVTDRALNEVSIHSEAPELSEFKPGVWKLVGENCDYYYEFDGNGRYVLMDASDKSTFCGKYTIKDGIFSTMQDGMSTSNDATIKWINPARAVLYFKEYDSYEELTFVQDGSVWDYPFYSDSELYTLAENYYYNKWGERPYNVFIRNNLDGTISLYLCDEIGHDLEKYTVERFTAVGENKDGKTIDLKEGAYFDTSGVWSAVSSADEGNMLRYFMFTEFDEHGSGKGVYAYQSEGIEHEFDCFVGGSVMISFSFASFEESGKPVYSAKIIPVSANTIILEWPNGIKEELTYHRNVDSISELIEKNSAESRLGDVNGDGIINAVDASKILVLYASVSAGETETDGKDMKVCDINGDSLINAVDASLVLAYYAELAEENELTLEEFLLRIEAL